MNTKKIIFSLGLWAATFLLSAQIDYSASQIAYSSLSFSQADPILGTARYSGMGGALGAFGGDATTLKNNPAGLGIYRSSDLTVTPNISIANDNSLGFNINNFAFVLNFKNSGNQKGYVTSSLGVSYSRLRNFKRNSDLSSYNLRQSMTDYITDDPYNYFYEDAYQLYLVEDGGGSMFSPDDDDEIDNRTQYFENGSIGEWNISYGINISNLVYLGISTGFVNLDYRLKTMYDEWDVNYTDHWYLDNRYEASGSGFNFKFGAIVAPADFLRIGLAFHTPTFYNIDEYISETIGDDNNGSLFRKNGNGYESDLQTPLKLQGSLGFIIGKRAIIGLEYQFENFSAMRFSENGILDKASKDIINAEMNVTHTAKIGAEVRIVDGLSLRAGFAYVTNPSTELSANVYSDSRWFQHSPLAQPQSAMYYTGGIGYKGKYFYADLAFAHQTKKETFFEYLPQSEENGGRLHNLTLSNNNIVTTFGFRF